MACIKPIAVPAKKGNYPETGFSFHMCACGKCCECKKRRVNDWAFRMKQQEKVQPFVWFITLTYDEEHVPRTPEGYLSLSRGYDDPLTGKHVDGDLTKFFKRYRKNTGRKGIKYYACGEYGSTFHRPHYHLILFEDGPYDVEADVKKAWTLNGKLIGFIDAQPVRDGGYAYCAKYCSKEHRIPMFDTDDRIPEFSQMSKGLGKNYLTDAMLQWHQEGMRNYVVLPGGVEAHLPRYYRNRIFSDEDRLHMFSKMLSGEAEKQIRGYESFGYSRSLADDCEANQLAKDMFYHARAESYKAAQMNFYKDNKRDKYM